MTMIDKVELCNNKDFFRSFKNAEDLTSFFKTFHKRVVEHVLEGELDAHLHSEKHDKTVNGIYLIGHGTKKTKTSFGEYEINAPRDKDSSFNQVLGPKRENIAHFENVIISLYAIGMSVSDIEISQGSI